MTDTYEKLKSRKQARMLYEQYYGLCILPGIHVYHKDGNCFNNEIDNLMICTPQEHWQIHYDHGDTVALNGKFIQFGGSCIGEKNGRYGKVVSKETRQKIGKANTGKPCKAKNKLRQAMIGLKRTDQNKINVAIGKGGGKPFLVYKNKEYVGRWIILRKCARDLNLACHRTIKKCLTNKLKHYQGYTFIYE